jgi:hypothetical protein
VVQLSPPLICGQEEIDFIAGTLREVLTEAGKRAGLGEQTFKRDAPAPGARAAWGSEKS